MILEHLDRVVANYEWLHLYPEALIKHLSRTHSNHCPLQLMLEHSSPYRTNIFRFETIWLSHPDFNSLIQNTWHDDEELREAIKNFTNSVHEWNHVTFGNIFIQKRQLLAHIAGLQASPYYPVSHFLQNKNSPLSLTTFLNLRKNFEN